MSKREPTPISKSKCDPLADFCDELHDPLDEIFDRIYIATHNNTKPAQAKEQLAHVVERLSEIRDMVFSHCYGKPREKKTA